LYQLEDRLRERTDHQRRDLRIEHALPILDEFRQWLDEEAGSVLPKSPLAKALTYTLNQWTALRRYTEDGRLSIDNNISERTVKVPAIGRKNWMFVASENGGRRAAILFSLVASCKANQVEPFAYLRDVFTRLPTQPEESLEELLPDVWLTTHPEHRWEIDAVRRQERRSRRHHSRRPRT